MKIKVHDEIKGGNPSVDQMSNLLVRHICEVVGSDPEGYWVKNDSPMREDGDPTIIWVWAIDCDIVIEENKDDK